MRRLFVLMFVVLSLSASDARAQATASTVTDLQHTLHRGERIQVITADGSRLDGYFDDVSPSSLRMVVRSLPQDVLSTRITEVRRRKEEPDSVLIGLGVGFAAGLAFVSASCHGASEHRDCINAGILVVSGPAALAGALVDWRVRHFETLFRTTTPLVFRLSVSPTEHARARGASVSLSF